MFMSLSLTLKLAHISLKNSIFSLLHQIFTIVKRFLFLVEDFSDYDSWNNIPLYLSSLV